MNLVNIERANVALFIIDVSTALITACLCNSHYCRSVNVHGFGLDIGNPFDGYIHNELHKHEPGSYHLSSDQLIQT